MYLLDANVFIEAKNRHYGFDFVPAFWDWLIRENESGIVASVEKIADELRAGEDELSDWAAARDARFFLRPDASVLSAHRRVSQWAETQNLPHRAVDEFLDAADCWLVAHALAYDHVVVTHEKSAPARNKIKIPNACKGLGLRCVTPFVMLRRERARFVLAEPGVNQRPASERAVP